MPWESVIFEVGSLTQQWEGAGEGRTGDWGKVVTRYPYENVGMDHLLSMEKIEKKTVKGGERQSKEISSQGKATNFT